MLANSCARRSPPVGAEGETGIEFSTRPRGGRLLFAGAGGLGAETGFAGVEAGDAIANKLSNKACPRKGPFVCVGVIATSEAEELYKVEREVSRLVGGGVGSATLLVEAEELKRANKSLSDCMPIDPVGGCSLMDVLTGGLAGPEG